MQNMIYMLLIIFLKNKSMCYACLHLYNRSDRHFIHDVLEKLLAPTKLKDIRK